MGCWWCRIVKDQSTPSVVAQNWFREFVILVTTPVQLPRCEHLSADTAQSEKPELSGFSGGSFAVRAFHIVCSVGCTTRLVSTCQIAARIIEGDETNKSSDT